VLLSSSIDLGTPKITGMLQLGVAVCVLEEGKDPFSFLSELPCSDGYSIVRPAGAACQDAVGETVLPAVEMMRQKPWQRWCIDRTIGTWMGTGTLNGRGRFSHSSSPAASFQRPRYRSLSCMRYHQSALEKSLGVQARDANEKKKAKGKDIIVHWSINHPVRSSQLEAPFGTSPTTPPFNPIWSRHCKLSGPPRIRTLGRNCSRHEPDTLVPSRPSTDRWAGCDALIGAAYRRCTATYLLCMQHKRRCDAMPRQMMGSDL
jgi:hypothetical protein